MDVHEFNTPVGKLCPVYCLIAPTYSQFPYNYHADQYPLQLKDRDL